MPIVECRLQSYEESPVESAGLSAKPLCHLHSAIDIRHSGSPLFHLTITRS